MRKILGENGGSPPSKETYASYLQKISSFSISPETAVNVTEEIWKNLQNSTEATANRGFSPAGAFDIEIMMTIPF